MIIHHQKGRHYARLFDVLGVWAKALKRPKSVRLCFTAQSKYTLDRGDQMDWNKAIGWGGLRVKRINGVWTRKTEDFLVWRYDARNNEFHVATYQRRNYEMILPKAWRTVSKHIITEFDLSHLKKNIIPLGAYFGGNRTAPKDLSYILQ